MPPEDAKNKSKKAAEDNKAAKGSKDADKKKSFTSKDADNKPKDADKKPKDAKGAADKKKKAPKEERENGKKAGKERPVKDTEDVPQKRQPVLKAAPQRKVDDYLGDLDLPSSSSEDEMEAEGYRPLYKGAEEAVKTVPQVSSKETRKLVDKERKLLEKSVQAKAEALRDDDNVFDVSYENQGDGAETVSATDIKVHNMTVRAKGKVLLEHTLLAITAGRRYGLVGPNGKGKSTLLRMVARRQVPVPPNLDVLLVEQEVIGDDRSALAAVVAADAELVALREEEAALTARQESGAGEGTSTADADDEDSARLNEIYERLQEMGSATAEARASKILHGLGFNEVMQRRATRDFSGGWRMRISLARALYIQPTAQPSI